MGTEKSPASSLMEAAKVEYLKQTKEKARKSLAENKKAEEEGYNPKSEYRVKEYLRNLESLRSEVAELEDFVNAKNNEAVVENSDIRTRLAEKQQSLRLQEEYLAKGTYSTSIEGLEPDVRQEMSIQFVKDLYGSQSKDLQKKQLKDNAINANGDYSGIEDGIQKLHDSLDDMDVGATTRSAVYRDWSEEISGNIRETKKNAKHKYSRESLSESESLEKFDQDYAAWQRYYMLLAQEAGMDVDPYRTNETIRVNGYSNMSELYSDFFTNRDIAGILKTHERYVNEHLSQYAWLQKSLDAARTATGFLGIGTLSKKLKKIEPLVLSFDSELRSHEFDTNSVSGLDASIDTLSDKVAERRALAERMKKVYELAIAKLPDVSTVLDRTPVSYMWKVERLQYAKDKLAELA